MYESMNQPIPDRTAYLKRIGLSVCPPVTPEGLNALVWAHQTHVPFEDLNTSWLKQPVSLEIPALYDKVVVRRRGGYCYELNALFTRLLLDLGFDARSVFCRVVRGRDFLPPCAHRAVVVALEGKLYFCDVGFGGPMPAGALPIEDGRAAVVRGEPFRIDRFDDYWWEVGFTGENHVDWRVLRFCEMPQQEHDFVPLSFYQAQNPESAFRLHRMANIKTADGANDLRDSTYTEFRNGQKTSWEVEDDALDELLAEKFGIANWQGAAKENAS